MKNKRLFALCLSSMSILLTACPNFSANDFTIQIIFTNDIHCEIKAEGESVSFAELAHYKKQLQKNYKYVTLVDSGDAIEGSVYGTLSKGEIVVDAMNLVGYDICALGNHEFNYGTDRLKELIDKSNATYLNANITYDGNGDNWIEDLPKYKIMTYGGTKVAYLGITTPRTTSTIATSLISENKEIVYNFDCGGPQEFYDNIQSTVDYVKSQGASYVIALAHLGDPSESDLVPYDSKSVANNTSGIDVILDGHSHTKIAGNTLNKDNESVLIIQNGTKLESVGTLELSKNKSATKNIVYHQGNCGDLEDEDTKKGIDELCSKYEETLNQVVATTNLDLPFYYNDGSGLRIPRMEEAQIGDFVSDALMSSVEKSVDVDIAFINGGGIRNELKKGDVTFRDIINVCPFGNDVVVSELKGQQILDMFEYFSRDYLEAENGGLMHISGAKILLNNENKPTYNVDSDGNFYGVTSEQQTRKIQSMQVYDRTSKTYVDIDPDKKYKVTSYDFILNNGGEGMFRFLEGDKPILKEVARDYQTLIDYLVELKGDLTKYATTGERITLVTR